MVKILSQAGESLADMYQAEGSIAGIEQLETRELPIVHEMGATVFSERFRLSILRIAAGATAQNTDIDVSVTTLPEAITRILGVQVFSDTVARVLSAQVSTHSPTLTPIAVQQDFPIWAWDGTNSNSIRLQDLNTIATFDLLTPVVGGHIPSFITPGTDQGAFPVRDIELRGRTTGFGAGTVTLTALLYLASTFAGGISSFGARVPSW